MANVKKPPTYPTDTRVRVYKLTLIIKTLKSSQYDAFLYGGCVGIPSVTLLTSSGGDAEFIYS